MSRPRRLTQRQYQERRAGKVAPVKPNQRPLHPVYHPGSSIGDPIVCGDRRDGDEPVKVESTGMVYGIRKGEQRWVVGSHVGPAIRCGAFVVLELPAPPATPAPTQLPEGAPGSLPELPGRIDQWVVGFTTCLQCGERPAEPGETSCNVCIAEKTDETPLERALRQAGSEPR